MNMIVSYNWVTIQYFGFLAKVKYFENTSCLTTNFRNTPIEQIGNWRSLWFFQLQDSCCSVRSAQTPLNEHVWTWPTNLDDSGLKWNNISPTHTISLKIAGGPISRNQKLLKTGEKALGDWVRGLKSHRSIGTIPLHTLDSPHATG